jgi:hypothetical protein
MARRKYIDMDPANTDDDYFANGATGATWTLAQTATPDELSRVVTITGEDVTDHSGKTAILVGTDADGRAQTETLALPNGTATVTSVKHYLTLTSVTPSETIGSDGMDIGYGDDIVSQTIPLNHWADVADAALIDVTGTINLDIELTFDPPNRPGEFTWTDQDTATWVNATNFAGKTADTFSTIDRGAYAARVQINSYTDTAEVQIWFSAVEATP